MNVSQWVIKYFLKLLYGEPQGYTILKIKRSHKFIVMSFIKNRVERLVMGSARSEDDVANDQDRHEIYSR